MLGVTAASAVASILASPGQTDTAKVCNTILPAGKLMPSDMGECRYTRIGSGSA